VNTLFPLGFPFATAWYLTWYVITLTIHVIFMNYVLGGMAYLVVADWAPAASRSQPRPIYDLLRDWLPFMLGAAITAGVAPLLFVQILYQHRFYTANLLLFHRWMSILPALMIGFYLLYFFKSNLASRFPLVVRWLAGGIALICFAFTGWSWTENHLLSLAQSAWVEHYAAGRMFHQSAELAQRLTLWLLGTIPNMAVILAWQLDYHLRRGTMERVSVRTFTLLPLMGLGLSALAAVVYGLSLDPAVREVVLGPLAAPYLGLACVGGSLQIVAWIAQRRSENFDRRWLLLASSGALLTIVGIAVVREARRLAAVDISSLYAVHEQASQVGGLAVFLTFFVLNALAITVCILLVRTGLRPTSPADLDKTD